jgi:hypothetical protein
VSAPAQLIAFKDETGACVRNSNSSITSFSNNFDFLRFGKNYYGTCMYDFSGDSVLQCEQLFAVQIKSIINVFSIYGKASTEQELDWVR